MRKKWYKSLGWIVGVLILLMVSGAFAKVEFTLTGDSVVAHRMYRNLGDPASPWDSIANTWTQTNRMVLTIKVSPDLYGVARFDYDVFPNVYGISSGFGAWDAGGSVTVKAANVNFKLPGIDWPTWVRVGIQDWVIRGDAFLNVTYGPGIQVSSTSGNCRFGFGWAKLREYDETSSATARVDTAEVSASLFYGLLDYKWSKGNIGFYALTTTGEDDTPAKKIEGTIWWLGLYSDGKVGPVSYKFDFIYDTGKENSKVLGQVDYKYSGWFTRAVLTYPYDKFTFGLAGLYASGDNYEKLAKGKVKGFVLPYRSGPMGAQAESLIVGSGWEVGPGPAGDVGYTTNPFAKTKIGHNLLASEGWPGMWGLRLFSYYKANKWLTLAGQIAYWGDTSKKGDSFEQWLGAGTKDKDEDEIGWEVNVGAKIDIYKNLTLRTVFGYLFAGDAMDMKEVRGKKIDDPFAWVTTLVFTY